MPAPDVRWLPEGIGGPALEDNPAAFEWTDDGFRPEPWPHAVLYELHLGTFSPSGTAVAAIDHLDHLVELGVALVDHEDGAFDAALQIGIGHDDSDFDDALGFGVQACHLAVEPDQVLVGFGQHGGWYGGCLRHGRHCR